MCHTDDGLYLNAFHSIWTFVNLLVILFTLSLPRTNTHTQCMWPILFIKRRWMNAHEVLCKIPRILCYKLHVKWQLCGRLLFLHIWLIILIGVNAPTSISHKNNVFSTYSIESAPNSHMNLIYLWCLLRCMFIDETSAHIFVRERSIHLLCVSAAHISSKILEDIQFEYGFSRKSLCEHWTCDVRLVAFNNLVAVIREHFGLNTNHF